MLNKRRTSVPQIACLLFFILVLASSTSANPFNKSDDSLSKKVVNFNVHISESGEEHNETIEVDTEKQTELFRVPADPGVDRSDVLKDFKRVADFNVRISESGEEYNEKIKVDTQKQTELFQVPAHPGVDRSDVLNDFKQKLTMIRVPEKKMCYLLPLSKEQSTPEKLIRDLKKAEQEVITEASRIDSTWIMKGEVTERSFLSDELQQFCADNPLYLVKKTQDSLAVTAIKPRAAKRKRRGINDLCPGGMTQSDAFERCDTYPPKFRCKVLTRTCYKYVICPSNDITVRPRPSGGVSFNMIEQKDKCREDHIYRNIICCEYICP